LRWGEHGLVSRRVSCEHSSEVPAKVSCRVDRIGEMNILLYNDVRKDVIIEKIVVERGVECSTGKI
jgi:hypothetical protein